MGIQFKNGAKQLTRDFLNLWEYPVTAAILAAFFYLSFDALFHCLSVSSIYDYYNYLADAFLHGQFSLRLMPPSNLDLSLYQGKYYLNWGPFPAIILMPFVALRGVALNDVIYTAVVAALCVGLTALLLRKTVELELLHIDRTQRGMLVLFLCLGTVLLTLAPNAGVWQTAQIFSFFFTILAYLAAFTLEGKKAWFLTGLMLTFATLSRATALFAGIFPFVYLIREEKHWGAKQILLDTAFAILPLFCGLVAYCYYDWARFGSVLETGLTYHLMAPFFRVDFQKYGASSPHYFLTNLYYEYFYYPFPQRADFAMGGSLFLLSPLFFAIFPAMFKSKSRWVVWALLASILVTNVPIMLHMSTGWVTFGPRYMLDFMIPLLLLTAIGIEQWKNWVSGMLVLISIAQYLVGYFLMVVS